MNLVYLFWFIMGWLMTTSVSTQSILHNLFMDPSEDPFLDPYIETIIHMRIRDIAALPKMNDLAFLQYLDSKNDATRGVTIPVDGSVFDPLRDDQLEHQLDIDKEWEALIVSGPIVVGYMGNLMVLASKKDFPFKAPEGYTYRYIRYPNSFRATLAQVSSDMYNALMGAHMAMDQIQLAIKQVPTHVKTAMKLIASASDAMLRSMLPRTLDSIGRLATESANVANSTLLRFNLLQELLAEIIELSASTQSFNEQHIEKMKEAQVNATIKQKQIQENIEMIKNQYSQSKHELETARQEYAKAMETLSESTTPEIIEGSSSLIEGLVNVAINLVFNPAKALGCLLGKCDNPKKQVDNTKFQNALKAAQLAKERLEKAEKNHNDHFLLQLAEQNELAKTIREMAMIDLSILTTDEIVSLLLEAVDQINLIKEQWTRMIEFFSKLAAQAHSTQQVVVKDFVEIIEQAQADDLLVDPFEREFFLELLIPAATTIESGGHLLYTMAKTYYAISSEHMITQIAGIGKMLALQTDAERTAQLQLQSNNTLATSLKITALAQERHALYLQETASRQTEYKTYINNLYAMELEGSIG